MGEFYVNCSLIKLLKHLDVHMHACAHAHTHTLYIFLTPGKQEVLEDDAMQLPHTEHLLKSQVLLSLFQKPNFRQVMRLAQECKAQPS